MGCGVEVSGVGDALPAVEFGGADGDLIHKSPAEFIDADSNEHLGEPRRGIYLRERACHA